MHDTLKNAVQAAGGALLALSLIGATLPAAADHHGDHAQVQADEFVPAEVRKIDKDAGKVTLKHGAIKKFDMAGMTMAFRVAEPAMLDGLAVGDRVRFMPDKRNGQIVIIRLEKMN